jgi:cardiolipin synthase
MRTPALKINLPNLLTLARILITPLFIILLIREAYGYALLVFTLAGITDGLDGFIARVFNQKTELGAFLDPIADKALLTAAFLTLAAKEIIPSWLSVIVVSRDTMIILGIAILEIKDIRFKVKPSIISKFTTAAQLASVFFTLAAIRWPPVSMAKPYLFGTTAVLTTLSGLHYIYTGLGILQGHYDAEQET